MSSSFTRQPNVVKGAFLALEDDLHVRKDRIFVFQYNPATITRTISHPDCTDVETSPIETIAFNLELDAADYPEQPDRHLHARKDGLNSVLATLESMMHRLDSTQALPIILFMLGPNRITPVRFSLLEITEEAFDLQLNPIRATISIQMQVLRDN